MRSFRNGIVASETKSSPPGATEQFRKIFQHPVSDHLLGWMAHVRDDEADPGVSSPLDLGNHPARFGPT